MINSYHTPCQSSPIGIYSHQSLQQIVSPPILQLPKNNPRCFPVEGRRVKDKQASLPSIEISKENLTTVDVVLEKYPELRKENVIGKLTVKLAKESFFGDEVLIQCTVMGCRNYPALPYMRSMSSSKLFFSLFPNYRSNPVEFETKIWNQCVNSIGQLCKRLRNENRTVITV